MFYLRIRMLYFFLVLMKYSFMQAASIPLIAFQIENLFDIVYILFYEKMVENWCVDYQFARAIKIS